MLTRPKTESRARTLRASTLHIRPARRSAGPRLLLLIAALLFLPAAATHGASEAEMDPIDVLRKEHQIIREMAGAAEVTAESVRAGDVDLDRVAQLLDFFRNFADRCHHAKEEDELFPALGEALDDATAVDVLVKQREEGRILLGGIEARHAAIAGGGTASSG